MITCVTEMLFKMVGGEPGAEQPPHKDGLVFSQTPKCSSSVDGPNLL